MKGSDAAPVWQSVIFCAEQVLQHRTWFVHSACSTTGHRLTGHTDVHRSGTCHSTCMRRTIRSPVSAPIGQKRVLYSTATLGARGSLSHTHRTLLQFVASVLHLTSKCSATMLFQLHLSFKNAAEGPILTLIGSPPSPRRVSLRASCCRSGAGRPRWCPALVEAVQRAALVRVAVQRRHRAGQHHALDGVGAVHGA